MNETTIAYVLRHADDGLVLSHRLAEWSSRAPDVEDDIALTNIGLDVLGQARLLYQYAGELSGDRTEDDYAYFRTEREFTNCLLVEQPNGDFADSIVRQVLFSAYQQLLWQGLMTSTDDRIAAIAAKATKEADYHLRWSTKWLTTLGDGTEESHRRSQTALDQLWKYTDELFTDDAVDAAMGSAGILPSSLRPAWDGVVARMLGDATLTAPTDPYQTAGGRQGLHTNALGLLLAEMQSVARTYPGATW